MGGKACEQHRQNAGQEYAVKCPCATDEAMADRRNGCRSCPDWRSIGEPLVDRDRFIGGAGTFDGNIP